MNIMILFVLKTLPRHTVQCNLLTPFHSGEENHKGAKNLAIPILLKNTLA